jgi:putative transposase
MKTNRYTEAQILAILRHAEGGVPVAELRREHGMNNASFYKWRAQYGGMDASLISQMKAIEDENRRSKRMNADLSMQADLLKEALGKSDAAIQCPEGKCVHVPWVEAARWPRKRWRATGSVSP